MKLSYTTLRDICTTHAAFRRRLRLQPVGGKGDKLFPSTYPGETKDDPPMHAFERRRIDGREVVCVILSSVPSDINWLEEALLAVVREGAVELPLIEVDFAAAGLPAIGHITSLDAPHRVYDAIIRDSNYNGVPFMKSEVGERLRRAQLSDATALLELSPTALIYGAWHTQGEDGAMGARFPRCVVSEIVGVDTPADALGDPAKTGVEYRSATKRTGGRIDRLGILKRVEVYQGENGWATNKRDAGKGAVKVRPSEINHGNIAPSFEALGVTMEYAEQTVVITCAGLRRLGFGGGQKNTAARAYLAALALLSVVERDLRGYALRSRCDLVPEKPAPWEIVAADGTVTTFEIDVKSARELYARALEEARKVGFALRSKPLRLTPQPKLVDIVLQSQQQSLVAEKGKASTPRVKVVRG